MMPALAVTSRLFEPADEPTFACCVCEDGGWRIFWCPGRGRQRAGEKPERQHRLVTSACPHGREHIAHTYAEACACRATNPVIAERRRWLLERQAKSSPRKGQR